ncbi:amino acid adenylation domain-containing protein [Kitasatospora sp. NPDC018058]|uniref:amino acid adenylation domain-containing protein n=1 Tax=Kitasatospora sp. NPDC018058 TaxID=3364025 RepID=UPI0037BEBAF6
MAGHDGKDTVDDAASREARIAALPAHLQELLRSRLMGQALDDWEQDRITRVSREGGSPISSAQQRLWYLHEVDPESIEYNTLRAVRLSGALDLAALRAALDLLVARHESLRTVFDAVDGVGLQHVRPAGAVPLPVVDLSRLPDSERESAVRAALLAEAGRPFDLRTGPVFRAGLLRLAEREHVLVLGMHHIVTDGWSLGVLVADLAALYSAETAGRAAELPELAVQYADFAAWQRDRVAGEALRGQLDHWREQLAGLAPLDLPTDLPRPPVRSGAGGLHEFRVPAELTAQLRELARDGGATLFMTLVAGVQLLLSRRAGRSDVAVATAVSGRGRTETEQLVGFFVNNLVLRSRIDESRSFAELLDSVRSTVLAALTNQEIPFQQVVEALRPERDSSRPALAEVAVNLHNTPETVAAPAGLRIEDVPPPVVTSSMDLSFDFFEREGELTGYLGYSTNLFTPRTVARLADHLVGLLGQIARAPGEPVADLSMLGPDEWHRLVEEWSGAGEGQEPRTVPELFAAQLARDPSAPALVSAEETLDYAELDRRANRLAHLLIARGAGPERLVAIGLPKSVAAVVAVLAVLKSGAAYLPLDLDHPQERLRLVLDDAAPVLLVTGTATAERLSCAAESIALDAPRTVAELAALPDTAPEPTETLLPAHPAYVIYTSGSTGRPKGVVVTHAGIHGLVAGQSAHFGTGPDTRVLQFASLSFDAAFSEIGMALLSGGTLVVAGKDELVPGEPLAALLTRHRVTHVTLPPSALTALPAERVPAGLTLVVAGEACPPALAGAWSADRRMINAYGPTESTVCATMSAPLDPAALGDGPVPIGRPLPGVRVRVLDGRLRPVPAGVPGEVYLSGQALARGYLGRYDLTAERFVADPYGAPGARMYRTGDRARWLADGTLDYLGRADDQVKLRGFRIEPGEIESVLARHPAVTSAAVAVKQDGRGTRRLVAYLVVEADGPDAGQLRAHAREQLPEYMVPAAFVLLDRLPLNANGKVDRRALPDPDLRRDPAASRIAPRNPVEETLARIWQELLGVEEIGVEDNFFDLGGDSILSLQVVARAREAGLSITARQTFLRQTVAELAAEAAEAAEAARAAGSGAAAERGPATGEVPLTPIHHWFFERLTDSLDRFNQAVCLELSAEGADEAALRAALDALVGHHDALRLRAERTDGRWRLHHPADGAADFERIDLAGLDPERREAAVRELVERAQTGFPLSDGPLLRARLLPAGEDGDQRPRLLLVAHHLVVDALSWQILLADLETGYRQTRRGEPIVLPPRSTSFQEWAVRLGEHTRSGGFADQLAYWDGVEAAAAAAAPLPVDHAGVNTAGSARTVSVRLDADRTDALLRKVPGVYRTQVNDVLLSALWRAVSGWTGDGTVAVALEGHGREDLFADVDLSRTVGWFTTLFPVVLAAPVGAGWGEVLKTVKERLRAVPSNGLGYGALRRLGGTEGGGAAAEPAISFNYLGRLDAGAAQSELFLGRLPVEGHERGAGQARHQLLEVNGWVADGQLEFHWVYSGELHEESTVRRVAEAFLTALGEIVEHCATPGAGGCTPSDFPLAALDQATVDRLVGDGRSVEDVYPLTATQSGMLFHALAEAGRDMYTGHFGVRLDGVEDVAALAEAWQRAVDRTPVLRTAVVWQDVPEPLQVVHTGVRVPFEHLDLRALPEPEREAELDRLWAERTGQSLDLATAPLIRVGIARLADDAVAVFWSTHHMMLDGWSFAGVLSDVFREYALLTGGPVGPATARRPYRDYVQWLAGQDDAEAERYWRGVLDGLSVPTPLPFDRQPVRAHGTRSSREERVGLGPERSGRLYEAARAARLTVNTLVQGAWAMLLARYSGEPEVCFGATVSGRPATLPGAEHMVGLFINTVPVRVAVDTAAEAGEWLRGLQAAQVEARQYEHVDLTRIQRWSGGPSGLFDSIVVFENYPYDEAEAARSGLRVGEYRGDEHTNYALTLTAHAGEELRLAIGYDPALFDPETVTRMTGHLTTLLDALAAAPHTPVGELPVLTEAERHRLLVEWNDTATRLPRPRTVPELFAEQAARTPDGIVVADGEEELTYRQLDERANRLAHHLKGLGVAPGALVGVCVARGVNAVVALLAVQRAGGAFVPLDPEYPAQRLRQMLSDADAPVVVTEERLLDRVAGHRARTVCLDRDRRLLAALPATAPEGGATPGDLAYVIYTSGTTGRPKGVMVEHRHVYHMVNGWDARYGLTALRPRVLSVSSLSVDLFFSDFLLAALFGGTMTICPAKSVSDPVALADLLLADRSELMITVPTLARAVVAELGWRGVKPESLKVLMVGSEGWPADAAAEVLAGLAPGTVLVNAYGSTETTVDSTVFQLGGDPLGDAAFVPIGRPLANTRIYVLDRDLRPVPTGVVGECWIAGDGVSRGYLGRPELTAERFRSDPFVTTEGARMYRTGDLARWRADGNLECLGRADDQVKIRGFRVELGEVEAALARHPAVHSAAAAVRKDGTGPSRLVGYVVASGPVPEPADLRSFLAESLPAAAVPTAYVVLDALPMTPSGTVDRRALPAPAAPDTADLPYTAPRTGTEELLAGIWAEVLDVARVGVEDGFFDLGGDSILSIRVISRIRAALGLAVSPRQLFDTPTVAGLAAWLDGQGVAETAGPVPVDRSGPLPLSSAQQRLWFLHDFAPEGTEYNTVLGLRLDGPLDVDALRTALAALVARHEPLRTVYHTVDGRGVQLVRPAEQPELLLFEPDRAAAGDAGDAAQEWLRGRIGQPFDLRNGPVLRAALARTGPDRHLLALVIHHIATDGWSMDLLARDLGACYTAALEGTAAVLPPLPVQYADYAAWQRERLDTPEQHRHLEYWRERLAGLAPLDLPTDRPRPAVRETAGAMLAVDLPESLADRLRALARQQDATLFMALVAAVQVVLSRASGQSDLAVGTPTSGRGRPELEDMVGFFVNTVVLRTAVDESLTFPELLGRVRETVLEAFVHEETPFDQLVEALRPDRDPSRNALVEVMVGLETDRSGEIRLLGLRGEPTPLVSSEISHDLSFNFYEEQGRLKAVIGYSTALFDPGTVAALAEQLRVLLAGAVTGHRRLADLPLPGAAESLVGPELPGPTEGFVESFERQAADTPELTALVGPDGTLTFAEANARANRLAHRLIARGIGPEQLVAVAGVRTVSTVVAVLAVLKAGAGYLPVDPEMPAERVAFMLDDARPVLVIGELPGGPHGVPVLEDPHPTAEPAGNPTDADRTEPLRPEHPAYVIFTSGSTGRPKGVLIEHAQFANFCRAMDERIGGGPGDTWLAVTSLSFDISTLELLWTLTRGYRVVVAAGTTADWAAHRRLDPTHLQCTPSYARMLLADAEGRALIGGLRRMLVGGEALDRGLARKLAALCPGEVVNMYGPTETTVWSATWTLEAGALERGEVSLGTPVLNTVLHVLDRYGRRVPRGTRGELWIGGLGVARGYHERPELTAERFTEDPYATEPGARMYRTGDLVRYRADGSLEFCGRIDAQVKLRGHRIELGEVEALLRGHPTVADAAAAVRPGPAGSPQLVAYVTPAAADAPDPAELRAFARQALPPYMVPAAVVVLDALPLTPSGKVDRRALPAPGPVEGAEGAYTAPRTETERLLAELWADVLGLERVGVTDDFFESGGDSILSIQLIHRIRRAGLRVVSRDLFLHPTVARLAEVVTPETAAEPDQDEPAAGEVPLTPIQAAFLGADPVAPHHFTQSVLIELVDDVDEPALRAALAELPARHDALRLRYRHTGEGWRQYAVAAGAVDLLRRHDLSEHPEPEQAAEMDRLAADADAALDLQEGPLLRALLFDLGTGRRPRLFLTAHHLVVDAVSWRILLDDLQTAYRARRSGEPAAPPLRSASFRRWAEQLRRHTREGGFDREAPYWEAVGPAAELPRDGDGPNLAGSVDIVTGGLEPEETAQFLRAVGRLRTSARDLLLGALARTLGGWTGERKVLIDLEGHGREEIFDDLELSRTVGWFTTLHPVALELPEPDADWPSLARSVRRQLRAVPGNGLGHGALRYLKEPAGPAAATAQVVFNYHGQADPVGGEGVLYHAFHPSIGRDRSPEAEVGHLLEVVGAVSGGGLRLSWYYSRNVHHRATVERLAEGLLAELRSAARHAAGR